MGRLADESVDSNMQEMRRIMARMTPIQKASLLAFVSSLSAFREGAGVVQKRGAIFIGQTAHQFDNKCLIAFASRAGEEVVDWRA